MSKLSITFSFDNETEAAVFLSKIVPTIPAEGKPVVVEVEKLGKPRLRSKPATATPVAKPKAAVPSGEFTNRKPEANGEGPVAAAAPVATSKTAATGESVATKPGAIPPAPVAAAPITGHAAPITGQPEAKVVPAVAPQQPTTTTPAPTIDDVRAALRTVFNKPGGTGAAAATALLTKFGATSVSTIPAAKYAEFIAACQ